MNFPSSMRLRFIQVIIFFINYLHLSLFIEGKFNNYITIFIHNPNNNGVYFIFFLPAFHNPRGQKRFYRQAG